MKANSQIEIRDAFPMSKATQQSLPTNWPRSKSEVNFKDPRDRRFGKVYNKYSKSTRHDWIKHADHLEDSALAISESNSSIHCTSKSR